MNITKGTCCYCGVGCGVLIETEGNQILNVRGDPEHPANYGRLCTKGSTLHLTARADARALYPEMRSGKSQPRQRISWDQALDHAADQFSRIIKEHGPDSVGFYISGQLLTEDYYVFNKLAKGLIGTNNIDTNSRLCMSSAVAAYKLTLGVDAPPCCYEDIDHAACVFIAGSNTAYAHPILFRRIEEARKRNPEQKLIVVDPRRTDTASSADLHLPILPGTDVALFNSMLHVMLWEGLCDLDYIDNHTEGFDTLKRTVAEYTPSIAAHICGVSAEDIIQAAKWFGTSRSTLSLYCQGLNQSAHGTDKNAALINLHLATGQIGRPGAGPFSLTGQPNAMGGREVGGMANLLPAHREMSNPEHRAEVARLWGIDHVPAQPGKTAVEMFDAVLSGKIKALWIACTNPAQSMPYQSSIREALKKAELIIVQESFRHTDTAMFADILLPATTWGEKEGTVTNSERRITHIKPAVTAPGEARHDWEIVVDFARRLGIRLKYAHAMDLFPYSIPEEIFNEHRQTTRSRDLDITGMSYSLLDRFGPQQWPYPEAATAGKPRLYVEAIFPTPSGRARFATVDYQPVAEPIDARFPLHLNTGRMRDQWHGMSRTGTVGKLYNHVEEPLLAMHPEDMQRRGIENGDIVKIKSRRGELIVRVEASSEVRPSQVFLPMHWGSQFMNGAGCNILTVPDYDPVSKQPELKHAAVQVEKTNYHWQMVVMRRGNALMQLQQIQPLLNRFNYATVGLYGQEDPVLILRIANEHPVDQAIITELDSLLQLDDPCRIMSYTDIHQGISKRILIEDGKVLGVRLTGEVAARNWLKEVMAREENADNIRNWSLAPVSIPPIGALTRGRIVCNCLDVSEQEIRAVIAKDVDLEKLQRELKCGTQCGSCVPQIKQMLKEQIKSASPSVD